ncbi:MAG TPA: ABC transporter ATP-binding protein [Chloroflexota bacterium]|jgi:ABC-type nitrate/sulfonate/bicarbonate transport system ATPase subunit|nr:ABC transporter ATP-binding protein [Chloroflexota bacterium]
MHSLAALEIRNIHKTFTGRGTRVQALAGVSLEAAPNQFVSIVGPSGCGKSTLFNLIAGLETPDRGEISIHGRLVTGTAGVVGYMPQKDLLFPWLTVLDNATLGLEMQAVSRASARDQACALMSRFGLDGFERRYPSQLSGGMRQRAAFLRTVLCRRDVMLLDEPFGALDALTRQSMQEWLLSLWDELRPTILFVTHDIDEALFLSDRVYVMSPRPGHMVLELDVPLPRPRDYHLLTEPHLVQLKAQLLEALRSGNSTGVAA